MHPLYVISGISGSGKTTIGKEVAMKVGATFIDQDWYFVDKKPQVTLSNGMIVSNYDCLEAIDPNFSNDIAQKLKLYPIVLVGFALSRNMLPVPPIIHIHLVTSDNDNELEMRCLQARSQAKTVNPIKDLLMVKEVVIPFYKYICDNSDITHYMNVYSNEGTRYTITNICESIMMTIQ